MNPAKARAQSAAQPAPGHYNPAERAKQKQASRDEDARDLASGAKSREQLQAENRFVPVDGVKIDYRRMVF